MLKIQVLGNGLIPRGLGLAPRKEPFSADLTLIRTIMSTPGLKVNMIRPDDSRTITLTNQNLMRMWQMYNDAHLKESKPVVPQTAPSTPIPPAPPVQTRTNADQENPHNITASSVGLGNVGEAAREKPITQMDVKTETPAENKTDVNANKTTEAPAATQEKVEDKKPETSNNNQNNNNNKSAGYTVKPINSDDRKNNGK